MQPPFLFLKSSINSCTLKFKMYLITFFSLRVQTIRQKNTQVRCCEQILPILQQILSVQVAIIQVSICLSIYLSISLSLYTYFSTCICAHQHCIYAGVLISIYLHNCLSILYTYIYISYLSLLRQLITTITGPICNFLV